MVVSTAKLVSFFYEMNLIVQCSVTFVFFFFVSRLDELTIRALCARTISICME